MKRNSKPFSIEIKKSRVSGHRSQLSPRRLFDLPPAQAASVLEEEVPQAVARQLAVPRILPSILEPMWSNSEAVEPVQRRRSPQSRANLDEMASDPNASVAKGAKDAFPEMPVIEQDALQPDPVIIPEEATIPAHGAQPHQTARPKAKSRKQAPKKVEPAMGSEPVSPPEASSKAEVIEPLSRRQAAAAHLPRQERWKRRLHPAAW